MSLYVYVYASTVGFHHQKTWILVMGAGICLALAAFCWQADESFHQIRRSQSGGFFRWQNHLPSGKLTYPEENP